MESMEKLGVFGQPSYISIGDEYDKKVNQSTRYKGKGFTTGPSKKGQGPDVTFDRRFKSLHEGDKYVDPGTHEKKYRLEQDKKKLTPDGFRYTSPPKRNAGSGNYYGCFNDKGYKHETEYDVQKKGELPEKGKPQLRNIITNPSKKGTYGVPGTTMGKGDEFRYISDPYDSEHRREMVEARESSKKQIGAAFKSTCRRKGCFDETDLTGASKIYSLDRPLPPKKDGTGKTLKPLPAAFKPSSPGKRGYNCTINAFPEYKEDPLELQERRRREEAKAAKPQTVWRPIGGPKSTPTRTIAMQEALGV
eukprot:Sspe_Gene.31247::Locus_15426_Transcript_1_1_Confidence_1.000_Length_1118::g.31247::m.31247